MDFQKALLVILITLVVVIIFNIGIYSYAKKRGSQVNLFTRIYNRAKHPWKEDNEKMKELSEYVTKFKDDRKPDDDSLVSRGDE